MKKHDCQVNTFSIAAPMAWVLDGTYGMADNELFNQGDHSIIRR